MFKPIVLVDLLRNVPRLLENRYIIRESFVDAICSQLEDLNSTDGRILVYGIAGSGKTTAVAQSIRLIVEEQNYFKPHGVYWIKIGNTSFSFVAFYDTARF